LVDFTETLCVEVAAAVVVVVVVLAAVTVPLLGLTQ
jgi:hypothetical protein